MNFSKFDIIRPYTDAESIEAFHRIAQSPYLGYIVNFLFPNYDIDAFKKQLYSLQSVSDFQYKIMSFVVDAIIKMTSSGMSYSGIENIKDGSSHLLLSNHRDIILDPAIIQLIFKNNDVPTTEIAVGDNLITSPFIEDITRSNRMIKVLRSGTPKEKYLNSILLSEYIRESVSSERCSIWIAQRNGRAKNGIDTTEQGLLKMLDISGKNSFNDNFEELSIVPVSISYEFEPCDFLKARELYFSRSGKYVKKEGEDLNSIITGVKQNKGHIHFHFNPTITKEEIERASKYEKNERFKALGEIIDNKIRPSYRLWNNNYIAFDIVNSTNKYSDKYTIEERQHFISYMEKGLSLLISKEKEIDLSELRKIYLSIYANPIYSL
jgi:hypothetical protein